MPHVTTNNYYIIHICILHIQAYHMCHAQVFSKNQYTKPFSWNIINTKYQNTKLWISLDNFLFNNRFIIILVKDFYIG